MGAEQFDPAALAAMVESRNIAAMLDDGRLEQIGSQVVQEYRLDNESMADWREQMKRGLDLAKLVKDKNKTYPWPNAANIKYPLITSAALQYNARAYPAIVPSDNVVRVKTFGADPQGMKAARGDRVAAHMSWQLASQIDEWEEETDKLLVQLPIVGTMVRKVWYDYAQKRIRCRLCEPGAFVVNDKVRILNDAPRMTEEMPLYPYEITERVDCGDFLDVDIDRQEDSQAAEKFIEQHTRLDLDGDGYPEPYIVTVHIRTEKVVRVVADFDMEDVEFKEKPALIPGPMGLQQVMVQTGVSAIRRGSYFIAYQFLPSMDGGFHGTGLGLLLGDISESINSIINMMLDAGHSASLGGGFMGSELRLKGGAQRMQPGEWRQVPAPGGDVRSAIVPITFPGPDATLFQLLGLLIEAGREIASVKDIMTGDTGTKNMTATTTLALIEQGMQVFTASYKRIFRSLKREFKLIAKHNTHTVSVEEYNRFHDSTGPDGQPMMFDPAQDYGADDLDIEPVADPRSVTKMQEAAKAQVVMQLAEIGMVDKAEAAKRVLESADIPDREPLAPRPSPMDEQMMQLQIRAADLQVKDAEASIGLKLVQIEEAMAQTAKLKTDAMKNLVDADATTQGVRLDELSIRLKALNDGLKIALGGTGRGVEGGAGNTSPARTAFAPTGPAQANGLGGVLAGAAMGASGTGWPQG